VNSSKAVRTADKQPAKKPKVTGNAAAPKAARSRKAPPKKILFAVSEVAPFVATGGMGQVAGVLPTALKHVSKGMDVRVVAPLYQQVRGRFGSGLKFMGSMRVPLAWRNQHCGVFMVEQKGVIYYFLDNEYYFDRENCYGYFDDGERFAFFSKAALAMLDLIGFVPDIIHAHDWQSALVPIYLKTIYARQYPDVRTVFTIHNIEYQGQFPSAILGDVFGLGEKERGEYMYLFLVLQQYLKILPHL